jgi:hypothetical protein
MLDNETLYRTISTRKSIRAFQPAPLTGERMALVTGIVSQLEPLSPRVRTDMRVVEPGDVRGLIQVKAPHYLVAFSQRDPLWLVNIGYMLQQLDLALPSNGIGCCWQGWPKPTHDMGLDAGLEFAMALAFGEPAEPLHRTSAKKFKRKPLDRITDILNANDLLEPVRLAPGPNQSWYFSGDRSRIDAFHQAARGLGSKMLSRIYEVEMGIALCHLTVAARHSGVAPSFEWDAQSANRAPAGYVYSGSIAMAG